MRVLADKLNRAQLGIGWSECLNENIRKKTDSLPDTVNICQQILAANDDSVFLHGPRLTSNEKS